MVTTQLQTEKATFELGDLVEKNSGDYRYHGHIVGIIEKLSGEVRIVVENPDGMLFIFHPKQLTLV